MNKVKEMSRISKVIEGLRMAFAALSINEDIVSSEKSFEKELKEIRAQENSKKIQELEVETTSVNIPLKDNEGIVKTVHVSEEKAKNKAEQVKQAKASREIQVEKQIGE